MSKAGDSSPGLDVEIKLNQKSYLKMTLSPLRCMQFLRMAQQISRGAAVQVVYGDPDDFKKQDSPCPRVYKALGSNL